MVFVRLIRIHFVIPVPRQSFVLHGISRRFKAVQGDMGHSSTDMLLNVYADIVDEERQKLARHMESMLYSDPKNGRGQAAETNHLLSDANDE